MVFTGEVGTGKTTLLQAFMASVDPLETLLVHISAEQLDAESLSSETQGQGDCRPRRTRFPGATRL